MTQILQPQPLTRETFAPFGDVIEIEGSHHYPINDGKAERFHDLAEVDVLEDAGRPLISIFRAQPFPKPFYVKMMERHPLSSQAFFPLSNDPFWVLVAPAATKPSTENLKLFITNGRQGVNFHRGVWHHPLLVLADEQDFLIVDRGGRGQNCDEFIFNANMDIKIINSD